MVAEFVEWLVGDVAKAVVLAIGALGTLLMAVVAILQYWRRTKLNQDIKRLREGLKSQVAEQEKMQKELNQRKQEVSDREGKLNTLRHAVLGSEEELWRIHPPRKFDAFDDWIDGKKPIVLTVANLKGGVGKTTVTTNLAAYFDLCAGKRVLVLDLDYQGSLSSMMLSAVGELKVESKVNEILDGKVAPGDFKAIASPLSPILPNSWVIPAHYALAALENRLMVEWLLQESTDDVRYRLAKFLADQQIKENFDIVLIDVPPRLSTGTINALCCSTHILVPTVLDQTSAEAVGTFLKAARNLKAKLNPGLALLGVVGTLTHEQNKLHDSEVKAKIRVEEELLKAWEVKQAIFERHIPRKMTISKAAGERVAYVGDTTDGDVRRWFNTLGAAIMEKI